MNHEHTPHSAARVHCLLRSLLLSVLGMNELIIFQHIVTTIFHEDGKAFDAKLCHIFDLQN